LAGLLVIVAAYFWLSYVRKGLHMAVLSVFPDVKRTLLHSDRGLSGL
jgi:hypothetical protein